jgi:acetolactate synthase-1/2/3 large subunit
MLQNRPMATTNAGARVLVDTLRAAGISRIFTLSGNHVMPVFDAALDAGVALIHVRHEAAAVHMADSWARLTGQPGIALVTGGPGHANAVGALYTAAMAESPVVLLSGHAPLSELGMGAFQEMEQAEIAAPLTKASWTSRSAEGIAYDVRRALRLSASGRPGPVSLSLPTDCLEGQAESRPRDEAPADPIPFDFDPAEAVAWLRAARRPLILTGPVTMTRRGRESRIALEVALGIAVVGMESPRGVADPALGAFAELLAQADRILLVGKRLDFTLRFGKPPAFAANREAREVCIEGDALSSLAALAREAQREGPMRGTWLSEVHAAIAFRPASWDHAACAMPGRLHPVQALRPLQAILDSHPDSVFVCDGGEIGQWAQACLSAPNRVINGVAGSIGAALPFALAARMARPDAPVVAVMGDGTFGFHPAELDTAVRYGLAFIVVIGNDARWNAEYQIQLRAYGEGRTVATGLLPTRYDEVARAFGGHGEHVTDPGQVLPAARRALAANKPAVVNIMIEGLAAPSIRR